MAVFSVCAAPLGHAI